MGYFNRDSNNRSGRDNRGSGRGFPSRRGSSFGRGGGDDRPREMFKAVCSNCGKDCEVPFRPTTGKPVYCSDCFEKMGGRSADTGRPERPEKNRSDFGPKHQIQTVDYKSSFEALNAKMDKIIALLTPKTEEAPKLEEVKAEKVVKTPKVKKASLKKDKVNKDKK